MPVRVEDRAEIIARINRKYENDIRNGDEIEHAERISTGSLELDAAMGGGVPQGRWTRFYGGYHSAKTLTAFAVAREAQKMGLTVAYYNVEKQYHPEFTRDKIGVDIDNLTIVEGTTVEEIGEKMEALLGVIHLHIIDSCTIAVSEDELNADIRDWRPGINARAWGKVFRRLNERFDQTENTAILIDQMRTNFKTGGEDPAGGRVFDFQSSMSVLFKKGSWLFRNPEGFLDEKAKQEKGMSGQVEPSGIEIKARVEKSRVCRPFRTASRRLDLDTTQFDDMFEITKAAKHYKIVEQRGSYYYLDGEKIGQGDKQLREYLEHHDLLQEKVREAAILAAMK